MVAPAAIAIVPAAVPIGILEAETEVRGVPIRVMRVGIPAAIIVHALGNFADKVDVKAELVGRHQTLEAAVASHAEVIDTFGRAVPMAVVAARLAFYFLSILVDNTLVIIPGVGRQMQRLLHPRALPAMRSAPLHVQPKLRLTRQTAHHD